MPLSGEILGLNWQEALSSQASAFSAPSFLLLIADG
jgi:hypothetical protein